MEAGFTYTTLTRPEGEPPYKFAEIKYGKIASINSHWVPLSEYRKFFDADSFFVDITGVLINGEEPTVGDVVTLGESGIEIAHFKQSRTIPETKAYMVEKLKLIRDTKEQEPIEYNGKLFDADLISLTRMEKARQSLEDNNLESIEWTLADNTRTQVTVADFAGINTAIAVRSSGLHDRYNALKSYINDLSEEYTPIILAVTWDWDMNQDLDVALAALTDTVQVETTEE